MLPFLGEQRLFDTETWRLNPAKPPERDEFTKPEDRPGWDVMDWPFQPQK